MKAQMKWEREGFKYGYLVGVGLNRDWLTDIELKVIGVELYEHGVGFNWCQSDTYWKYGVGLN